MNDHPKFLIALPSLREKDAPERWTAAMYRGEPWRVVFRHAVNGHVDLTVVLHWSGGQWLEAVPAAVPPHLAARAHRVLRHRVGRPGAPQQPPSERLNSIRRHLAATAQVKANRRLVKA